MTNFGFWTLTFLVVANMIGAGVFLSAGFMAQQLSAGWILAAWSVGALLAMAGARSYAEVALLIPRSGGEYRYLSDQIDQLSSAGAPRRFLVNLHLGDFALWMTGIFPDHVSARVRRRGAERDPRAAGDQDD